MDHSLSGVKYTFESCSIGTMSCIDHIMVSEHLFGLINKYEVFESIENCSDHLPVLCTMDINVDLLRKRDRNFVKKAAWSKASLDDISQYKHKLDDILQFIHVPTEAVQCCDPKCERHSKDIDLFHKAIVDSCLNAAESSIPATATKNKHKIPGWNQFVKEKYWSALFWHERWKENGRPTDGELAAVMRYTRHKYHYAVRECKKNSDSIKATRMAEAMINNHTRDFWSEIRKLSRSKKSVPVTVDEVSEPCDIADLFYNKFKQLYCSIPYDKDNMNEFKNSPFSHKQWDCEKLMANSGSIVSLEYIVKLIFKKMLKPGKSDVNSALSSGCIIHGSHRLFILHAQHMLRICCA